MKKLSTVGLLTVLGLINGCSRGPNSADQLITLRGSSVVAVLSPKNKGSGGTGFAARASSGTPVIVSNSHVCEVKDSAGRVLLAVDENRAQPINGYVIVQDPVHDLCLISGIPSLTPFTVATPIAGEPVIIVGYPLLAPLNIATGNIIRRINITLMSSTRESESDPCPKGEEPQSGGFFMGPFCTREADSYNMSVHVYPGNSGSPVINQDGIVVGVVFAGNNQSHFGAMIGGEHLINLLNRF